MEPILDNRDEEALHARRAERIARMRREKQVQEQRRRMIRKYLPLGAGVLGVIIIMIIVSALIRKPGGNEAQQQTQVEA